MLSPVVSLLLGSWGQLLTLALWDSAFTPLYNEEVDLAVSVCCTWVLEPACCSLMHQKNSLTFCDEGKTLNVHQLGTGQFVQKMVLCKPL